MREGGGGGGAGEGMGLKEAERGRRRNRKGKGWMGGNESFTVHRSTTGTTNNAQAVVTGHAFGSLRELNKLRTGQPHCNLSAITITKQTHCISYHAPCAVLQDTLSMPS